MKAMTKGLYYRGVGDNPTARSSPYREERRPHEHEHDDDVHIFHDMTEEDLLQFCESLVEAVESESGERRRGYMSEAQMKAMTKGLYYRGVGDSPSARSSPYREERRPHERVPHTHTPEEVLTLCVNVLGENGERRRGYMSEAQMKAMTKGLYY